MSSSSSVPEPVPSPFEVFLSFRGADTRNNFVSHLRSALLRRGIVTYYDATNLQNGQTIAIELVKAIKESAIAIVVLSKNYGSSTWCLNELVKIVECMNKNKLIIYPIFYDVDPSHVRKQQESFLEAFSIHEVNFKDNIEMVNSWRKALTMVANLTGVDVRGKNEASCIEEIADEILWKLPLESSHFTESLVGIESRISAIKILINKNPDEVRFIGFWGMGGVGKTTTARVVFHECRSEFEGSCFLLDVRRRKSKLEKLQQQLISEVLKCKVERIYDVVEGSSMIRKRMCSKRVLLVVDDVDDIHQLNVLAGKMSWFGKGSRIIITTRDEHLLNDIHDKYVVDTLNAKEALHLFRDHAFKNEHPEVHYKNLSHQVLRYASGLPLALEVLGDHLYRRKESFWLYTLRRLKEVPEKKIISILQISFDDGLNSLQKDIFLYIACFFRGKTQDGVMECLRALCLYPEEGIEVLIQKSLIHESRSDLFGPDTSFKSFEMHDLLQDMGQHIVRQKANLDVTRYSHLWLEEDIKTVLLDYKGSAEAEGIIIEGMFYDDAIKSKLLTEESFMHMNKLRFLHINNGDFFQSSVQLPNGLRWLCWNFYAGKCLGKSFYARNLVHMEMVGSLIETTPDFSHLPNLEVLNMSSSEKLIHIHASLGLHIMIRRVDLLDCKQLKEFPAIIGMNSLEYLNLSRTGLPSFPEICGDVDSLEELHSNDTYIIGLPKSVTYTTGLRKLVHLEMSSSLIERTPDFSHMPNLEALNLSYSYKLVHIHPSLGLHMKIKRIDLVYCRKLKDFPTIVRMNSLECLNLCLTGLQTFPVICGNVDSLEELNFGSTYIIGLPVSIQYATSLRRLWLGWRDHDTVELEGLSIFEYLHSLTIVEFTSLTTVPDLPSSLHILELLRCPALKEYPKSFPYQLETLQITFSNIEKTPDFSHLPYLLKLDMSGSSQLSQVHPSLGVHKKIVYIYLRDCINLNEFPTIVDMGCLETLELSHTNLQCFPEIMGMVSSLVRIGLEGTCISTLPESIGRATCLQFLNITSCEYLVGLPVSLQVLENLTIFPLGTELPSRKRKEETDDTRAIISDVKKAREA